jgi:uncharacterized protein (TIGR02597 family)
MGTFMKLLSSRLPLLAALAGSIAVGLSAQAQNTATTDPVGFITLNVAGGPAEGSAGFSFKGLGLTRPIEYQGNAEAIDAARVSVTDNDATWTGNQFNSATAGAAPTHYIEIVRPVASATAVAGEGTTYDIIATNGDSKTITLAQPLATGVAPGALFKIRKHWTLASVFGPNNESGLGGGTPETADEVTVLNSAGTGYETYFYQVGGSGNGWRSTRNLDADAAATVLYPEEGLVIKRKQTTQASIVLTGAVKTGASSIPVLPGTNMLGNVFAAPVTLASSNLYTGNPATGLAAGNLGSADQVLLYNGTSYDVYYYQAPSALDATGGWKSASNPAQANVGGVQIPVGAGIILKRKAAGGFDWQIPQHPAAL